MLVSLDVFLLFFCRISNGGIADVFTVFAKVLTKHFVYIHTFSVTLFGDKSIES